MLHKVTTSVPNGCENPASTPAAGQATPGKPTSSFHTNNPSPIPNKSIKIQRIEQHQQMHRHCTPRTLAWISVTGNECLCRQRRRGFRRTSQSSAERRILLSSDWGHMRQRTHSSLRHSRKLNGRWVTSDTCDVGRVWNLGACNTIWYNFWLLVIPSLMEKNLPLYHI